MFRRVFNIKYVNFFIVFLFGKGALFFAPILLSNIINNIDVYGKIEYLIGTALLFQNVINIGFNGAIPYFLLKKKEKEYSNFFYTHLFYLSAISLAIYFFSLIFYNENIICVFIAFIFALQVQMAARFKSDGEISLGVFAETIFYLSVAFFSLILIVANLEFELRNLIFVIAITNVIIVFYSYIKTKKFKLNFNQYKKVFKYTKKVVLFSITIIFIYHGQRFLIGVLLSDYEVGVYSLIFRMSAVVVVLHQFITNAVFKQIYESKARKLDFLFTATSIAIFFSSLIIWFYSGFFSNLIYDENNSKIIMENPKIHLIIIAQIILWINSAQNENIINREDLAAKAIKHAVIILAVFLILFFLLIPVFSISLKNLLLLLTTLMFFVNGYNYWLLYKNNIKLKITAATSIILICSIFIFVF